MTCLSISRLSGSLRSADLVLYPRGVTRDLWSVSDLARALGITRQSVLQAIAEHRIPQPDYRTGLSGRPTMGWRESTIHRWATRTGRSLAKPDAD